MGDINKELTITAETEGFPAATVQVAALKTEVDLTGGAAAKLGTDALTGQAGLSALQAEIKATIAQSQIATPAIAATAGSVGLLSRALMLLTTTALGPLVLVLVLLITHFKEMGEWVLKTSEKVDVWIRNIGRATPIIDDLTKSGKAAADSADLLARAHDAMSKGVIAVTHDTKIMVAEYIVHQAAVHQSTVMTDELAAAQKLLGIKSEVSFAQLKNSVNSFMETYKSRLERDGVGAANAYAEANRKLVEQTINRYHALRIAVEPDLQAIADALGIVAEADKKAAEGVKLQDKYNALKVSANELAVALAKSTAALELDMGKINDRTDALQRAASLGTVATTTQIKDLDRGKTAFMGEYKWEETARTDNFASQNKHFADIAMARAAAYALEVADKAKLQTAYQKETADMQVEFDNRNAALEKAGAALDHFKERAASLTGVIMGVAQSFDLLTGAAMQASTAVASVTDGPATGGGGDVPGGTM